MTDEPLRFPHSRVRPPGGREETRDLGPSRLSQQLGTPRRQLTGHWCSPCQGIWWGSPLEAECPLCGGRQG